MVKAWQYASDEIRISWAFATSPVLINQKQSIKIFEKTSESFEWIELIFFNTESGSKDFFGIVLLSIERFVLFGIKENLSLWMTPTRLIFSTHSINNKVHKKFLSFIKDRPIWSNKDSFFSSKLKPSIWYKKRKQSPSPILFIYQVPFMVSKMSMNVTVKLDS